MSKDASVTLCLYGTPTKDPHRHCMTQATISCTYSIVQGYCILNNHQASFLVHFGLENVRFWLYLFPYSPVTPFVPFCSIGDFFFDLEESKQTREPMSKTPTSPFCLKQSVQCSSLTNNLPSYGSIILSKVAFE